ncbi:MAG: alpha-ketoglutarate-dependent dioxygenase AlkB [Aureibaculum sp.]|nr:alpha-ketoglutarate-dependent dioxygenase AlkB [Aureibaculum sp.]
MNLFETYRENILPFDGEVINNGVIMNQHIASHYFDKLLKTIKWRHDELLIFGKHIHTKRKVAWYGDVGVEYTYSNKTKNAIPWTSELIELKKNVERITEISFNSCLLNLYHNGEEGMSWHSDNEKELGENSAIASLSLGAQRKFDFKHRIAKQKVSLLLESGSLLIMKGKTQEYWLHALPKTKKVNKPRINVTFRRIVEVI